MESYEKIKVTGIVLQYIRTFIIMVVIHCYLDRENYKVLKF